MNKVGILTSWKVYKDSRGLIYISNTQYLYLEYLVKNFNSIYLLCPVYEHSIIDTKLRNINFDNLTLVALPSYKNYINALSYFSSFRNAILKTMTIVDYFYCSAPDPYCWLPSLLKKNTNNRLHFVSDIVEVTLKNKKLSFLKKTLFLLGYLPEYILTIIAGYRSKVFTNGKPLAIKLNKKRVFATSVISSTIRNEDLFKADTVKRPNKCSKFIYVGYLRNSKGIDTIIDFIKILEVENTSYVFTIIGIGDMFETMREFIISNNLQEKVLLMGRIDDRKLLYSLMCDSDYFFFPSLSEGSPRVVIEAMSQKLLVISTPVGSLPTTFKNGVEICFFDFNNARSAFDVYRDIDKNPINKEIIINNAFSRVKNEFTLENFLDKVFIK